MNQARTWEEFREACSYNRMPSENMVWVDRKGTIGWQAAGIAPLRSWSGLLPVPGDGRFEWDGYLPITALPSEVNPARGYIATANHYLFPNDYAYDAARHWTWADPYRARRIEEVLGFGQAVQRRRGGAAAERRPVAAGPGAGAAAARPAVQQPGRRPRRATCCCSWDFVLDKDSAGSRRVRAVLAAALRQRAPGGDSGLGARASCPATW